MPPDSSTRILFLFAIGQPDALQQVVVIAIKDKFDKIMKVLYKIDKEMGSFPNVERFFLFYNLISRWRLIIKKKKKKKEGN